MKKNVKKSLLANLFLGAVCTVSFGALSVNNASAERQISVRNFFINVVFRVQRYVFFCTYQKKNGNFAANFVK